MSRHLGVQQWIGMSFSLLIAVLLLFSGVSLPVLAAASGSLPLEATEQFVPMTADGQIPLWVAGSDPAALALKVEELGGRVTRVFDHIDALAVTLPADALPTFRSDERVQVAERQRLLHRAVVSSRFPEPVTGLGPVEMEGEIIPLVKAGRLIETRSIPLSGRVHGKKDGGAGIGSLLGYDFVTGAADSWEEADYGEGTVVSVIDTGIYPFHPLYSGNVIGGINLVPVEEEMLIDHTGDGIPDGQSFDWDAIENHDHGTFVSGLIAGHADLLLPEDDPFVQSVAFHSPESVEFHGDGYAAIHLMGTAPAASLFAVKVFPYNGAGAPDARVAEAIDRLITMKQDGTLATDVINMSLSGPVLNDGRCYLDQIVDAATQAGITVVSAAANDGPALASVGSPGSAVTSLTVGGAVDPLHTRVAFELFFGAPPGMGNIIYPEDDIYIVDFSARGLTADHRVKPDIVATGFLVFSSSLVDWTGDGLNDMPSFGFSSGTSFSTPTVAGAAALVTSFARNQGCFAEPPYIANALRRGASPIDDFHDVSQREQGRGFVNLPQAFKSIRNGQAQSPGSVIPAHQAMRRLSMASGLAQGETPSLDPGKCYNFLIDIPEDVSNVRFEFTGVTLGNVQNPVFGDGMTVTVHSAKRGGCGDYVFGSLLAAPGEVFNYPFPEPGTARLTVIGNFTNYSPGSVAFQATAEPMELQVDSHFEGELGHDGVAAHVVEVPDGLQALAVRLSWKHDWTRFPTYDLDLFISGPGGPHFVGSLNSPEMAYIQAPDAGEWTFVVYDFGTIERREPYDLDLAFIGNALTSEGGRRGEEGRKRPMIALGEGESISAASKIRFSVPEAGSVQVQVFDVTGRLVKTLAARSVDAGEHQIRWEGRSEVGRRLSTGVYFLRLNTETGMSTRKIFLR